MRWLLLVLGAILPSLLGPCLQGAELSVQESRRVASINAVVAKAAASYAKGEFETSGQQLNEAMALIQQAVGEGSPELYDQLEPALRRIEKAHTLLEFEGVSLPPFERPARPEPGSGKPGTTESPGNTPGSAPDGAKPNVRPRPAPRGKPNVPPSTPPGPTPPGTTPPSPTPPNPAAGDGVSFTTAVAPILASRCGRCHIGDKKGGFGMTSFSELMKGPPEGVVIFAGDTVGSRLIETIETGDMPRGGGKVSPQELQTLKAWIVAGAKFDGVDPEAPLAALTPGSPGATAPAPVNMNVQVTRATGKETVSFAADVAPLLVEQCRGCHIEAMQTRGGLRMDTFAQLLRGGDSGAVIIPGKGSESLLVQKLRGMVGDRMPAGGRPALAEESIQLISTWIDEGATLDGASETQPLGVMSQLAWAASASASELSERRREKAAANLKLVTASSDQPALHDSDHFLVTGPVSPGTLKLVADLAESQMKTVRTVIKAEAGEAFYRGKATIFVFPKRYDYSEFAKMVESRSVPGDWNAHWSYDGIDGYVSIVASEQDAEEVIESRLASPLVSLAVATRGRDIPHWFAEGVGTATAYRLASTRDKDARRQQDMEIMSAVASVENGKQFLEGKLPPEQTDRVGAALASAMMDRTLRRNFDMLIRSVEEGMPFEEAFQQSFRATPTEFVEAWLSRVRSG